VSKNDHGPKTGGVRKRGSEKKEVPKPKNRGGQKTTFLTSSETTKKLLIKKTPKNGSLTGLGDFLKYVKF
jgi:hypothetical protein